MYKIIALSNQKGGVGKTTSAINLAKTFSNIGKKVLVIDNDPQGNLTKAVLDDDNSIGVINSLKKPGEANSYFLYEDDAVIKPIKVNENLDVIGASKHLAEMSTRPFEITMTFAENVKALAANYDLVFIDCLPSFGNIQTAAFVTATDVIIPTLLDDFSVTGINEMMKVINKGLLKKLNPDLNVLGILVNQKSAQKVLVEHHFLDELKEAYGDMVLETMITHSKKMVESHVFKQSIKEYNAKSKQAEQYDRLMDEVLKRLGG